MGVVKDEAKAVRLFRHAAKLGAAEVGNSEHNWSCKSLHIVVYDGSGESHRLKRVASWERLLRGGARIHDLRTEGMLNYGLALLRGSGGVKVQDLEDMKMFEKRRQTDRPGRKTWGLSDVDTKDGFWFWNRKWLKEHLGIERWTTKKLWSGRRSLQRFVPSFPHQDVAKVVLDHVPNLPITFPSGWTCDICWPYCT